MAATSVEGTVPGHGTDLLIGRYLAQQVRQNGAVALVAGGELHRADVPGGWALLRKSADDRTSPFPGHTYPAATVIGIPSAVKRLRTAARIWTSATWRSKSRDINRWPSSFTQFIFVSTLLRR